MAGHSPLFHTGCLDLTPPRRQRRHRSGARTRILSLAEIDLAAGVARVICRSAHLYLHDIGCDWQTLPRMTFTILACPQEGRRDCQQMSPHPCAIDNVYCLFAPHAQVLQYSLDRLLAWEKARDSAPMTPIGGRIGSDALPNPQRHVSACSTERSSFFALCESHLGHLPSPLGMTGRQRDPSEGEASKVLDARYGQRRSLRARGCIRSSHTCSIRGSSRWDPVLPHTPTTARSTYSCRSAFMMRAIRPKAVRTFDMT